VTTRGSLVVGEVGAEHARRRASSTCSSRTALLTSAPIPHWRPAADKEVPVWVDYLERAAADAIGEPR
jgi:hypothetical protein